MNRFLAVTTALSVMCVGSFAVQAADYAPIPDPDPIATWAGLYLGAHGGGVWGDVDADGDDDTIRGWMFGPLAGFNFQSDSFVFGIEGDLGFGNVDGRDFNAADLSYELRRNAHVRGRIGYDMGSFMPFIAGGLALARFNAAEQVGPVDDTNNHTGFTIGGGVDFRASNNLWLRLEYLHDEFNEKNYDVYAGVPIDVDTDTVRAAVIWHFD